MRIDEFHIDGFGRFTNQSFINVPPGLSVILGDNEAGKSTLLAFLRSILFGFPSRKQKEFYPPLNGGRKRGRIVLIDRNTNRITVERCEGKGVGPVTVTASDGTSVTEEELRQRLGSATANLYENVFAFSLSELQAFETLKTESIRDAIYSAGIGVGQRSITQVLAELKRQSSELFAPGGSKPLMNKLLARIEGLTHHIRQHETDINEYQRLQVELHAAKVSLDQANSELNGARRRCAQIEVLQQARNDWIALEAKRSQLEELRSPAFFPDDGLRRLDELIVERRSLRVQIATTTKEIDNICHQQALIVANDLLIAKADEIYRLDRGRELHNQNLNRQKLVIRERELAETKLCNILKSLGEEWSEEKLQAFSLSVAQQEELETCRRNLQSARELIRNLEPQCQHAQRQLRDAIATENDARTRLEQIPNPSSTLDAERVTKLVLARQSYESARQDLPTVETQCSTKVENLEDTLQQIGPDWTEARLRHFDTSLAVQEKITSFRQSLSTCGSELQDAIKFREASSNALQAAQSEVSRAEEILRVIPVPQISDESALLERKRRVRALQQQVGEVLQQKSRLDALTTRKHELIDQQERLQAQADWVAVAFPTWLFVVLLVVGLIALLLFGLVRNDWLAGGAIFVVAMIIAFVLHITRNKTLKDSEATAARRATEKNQLESKITSLNLELSQLQQQHDTAALQICKHFKPPRQELPALHDLDELEAGCDRDLDLARQRRPAEQRHKDGLATIQKKNTELALAETAATLKGKALDAMAEQWQQWLRDTDFPDTLLPDDAANLLSRLNIAREQLKGIDNERSRIDQMVTAIRTYEAEVKEVAQGPNLTFDVASPPSELVNTLTAHLDEEKRLRSEFEHAKRQLDDALSATARMRKNAEDIADQLKTTEASERQFQEAWQAMLEQFGMRRALLPESIPQLLQAIERAQDQLITVRNKRLEEDDLQHRIDSFWQASRALAKELQRPEPVDAEVLTCVGTLAAELKQNEQACLAAKALAETLEKCTKKRTDLDEQIGQLQAEIDNLLLLVDAADEEAFRTKASGYFTRCDLQKEIEQLEGRLVRAAGNPEGLQSLKEELTHTTPDELNFEFHECEQVIARKESEVTNGAQELGRLAELLRQLENTDELSRLRADHQAALSELHSSATEWSILSITAHLIERARSRYERERRPAVLKEAEHYFCTFTNGNYIQLRPSADGDQVIVMSPNGETKNVDQLSRGTAEQLYLSLRFGFIQEFSRRSEPLPLIFDDILVNFDPERAKAAAAAILDLSKSQQILFFTCHPATVQLFRRLDDTVPVYRLKDGCFAQSEVRADSL